MRQATIYHYNLPINTNLVLKECKIYTKEGLFLHLCDQQNEGWGEISPLIGFSWETLNQAQNALLDWTEHWLLGDEKNLDDYPPSVAFGISMALKEFDSPLPMVSNIIPVPLYSGDLGKFIDQLSLLEGQKIAKFKIARKNSAEEGREVNALLRQFPNLYLRLDANRAWSLSQAQQFSDEISPLLRHQIEFIEEPCHTPELSVQFAQQEAINIAWDESLREDKNLLKSTPYLSAVVIKPTLTGSIEKCRAFIQQAQQLGLKTVISSSLESSLGLSQLAQIANKYTPNIPAGLDTLNLMPYQLIRAYPNCALPLLDIGSPYIQKLSFLK